MKLVDKVWLACAIDSEGMITLVKNVSHGKQRITYSPRIVISNQSFNYLDKCRKIIGDGRIYDYTYSGVHNNYRAIHILKQKIIKEILQNIYPYLVVKQELARLVLRAIHIGFEFRKNSKLMPIIRKI